MHAILADTGPLYAASIASDQYHQRAQAELVHISESDLTVLIPYPTVMETYSLLLRRVTPNTAQQWLRDLQERASLISPTSEDYEAASSLVMHYPDQRLTLFDALLVALSENLAIPVWTYDFHFDLVRAVVWR
jgi:predicted nucleic acid-binding protein